MTKIRKVKKNELSIVTIAFFLLGCALIYVGLYTMSGDKIEIISIILLALGVLCIVSFPSFLLINKLKNTTNYYVVRYYDKNSDDRYTIKTSRALGLPDNFDSLTKEQQDVITERLNLVVNNKI